MKMIRTEQQQKKIPVLPGNGLASRIRSFRYALKGIAWMLIHEPNARIHAVATVLVTAAGLVRGLSAAQWLWIVGAVAAVWVAEALNTAIEQLCDLWCDRNYHPAIAVIKDVAAGAVLLAAIAAVIIGSIVFTS